MNREPVSSRELEARSKSPLAGRAVIITRQKSQAADMTARLEAMGAEVICVPAIQTVAPESWEQLDAAIDRINLYDWVVFTSSNAVGFFAQRLVTLGRELTQLSGITSVAIGPGTFEAMGELGIHTDVVARDSKAEGALAAIIEHAGGQEKVRGQRFLLPRSAIARDVLPNGLRGLGADVDAVEAYTTVKPKVDIAPVIARLEEGTVDAVAFTSSSTVSNFADLISPGRLIALLDGVLIGCIGPATAHTARALGLQKIVEPTVHTAPALIDSLAEALIRANVNKPALVPPDRLKG
ncbi:MAG TPA: uroporphyrinogen-III synthase [Blastocatellia bacterium]